MGATPFEEVLAGRRQIPHDDLLRMDLCPAEMPELPSGDAALRPSTRAGWGTEAPKRALISNLRNGADWRTLYIYGGSGKAARSWDAALRTIGILDNMGPNETLLMQSGVPYGVTLSHPLAPRVAITNSLIVPDYATADAFDLFVRSGLSVFGQMTAGSWIFIGYQGILQGTYETIMEAKRVALSRGRGAGDSLEDKLFVSVGTGLMSGAQPLAAKMANLISIVAEVDMRRLEDTKGREYLDEIVTGPTPNEAIESALAMARSYAARGEARSIGVHVNGVDLFQYLVDHKITPLIVTEQSSAHEIGMTSGKSAGGYKAVGYCPAGMGVDEALALRNSDPGRFVGLAKESTKKEVSLMLQLQSRGAEVFDYGNSLVETAHEAGLENARDIGGFVPKYVRSLFCEGKGPFRWAALSNDPNDIRTTDAYMKQLFHDDPQLVNWLDLAGRHIKFEKGLPARVFWAGLDQHNEGSIRPGRLAAALLLNELYAQDRIRAPVIIGRDHLDGGSVDSYTRETLRMRDGSDAIADFSALNLLANASAGATWVSYHGGGGVGIGRSLHAGQVIVADGTDLTMAKMNALFHNDPLTAVLRHVSAGYDAARATAETAGIFLPMTHDAYRPFDYRAKVDAARALIHERTGITVRPTPTSLTIDLF